MSFVVGSSGTGRRRPAVRRGWVRLIGPVSLVLFFSTVALGLVWQNVRYTHASLKFEETRRQHESLLSDLNAQHMKVSREVTLSQLEPRARKTLGLTDASTEDMRLVAFDPELDRTLSPDPSILDRLVPAAVARESRTVASRHGEEARQVDQGRP